MIFGSGLATAEVGRVSPRPQDRGRNCALLGREPLHRQIIRPNGRWLADDPAVSERRALPPRSPGHSFKSTCMGPPNPVLKFRNATP
jgi:hypothetical protein